MALTVVSILFLVSAAYGKSVYQHQTCSSDADCTYPETYCYRSGMCVECTDCSKYNRLPGSFCARNKNQCGQCLPGMDKVENTDESFSCEPSGTLTPSTQPPFVEDANNYTRYIIWGSILIFVLVIVSLIIICVCVYQKYSNSKSFHIYFKPILKICPSCCVNRCEQQHPEGSSPRPRGHLLHPEGPPPYSEHPVTSMASAPPYEGLPLTQTQTVIQAIENDPSQTANAFLNPTYVRGGNLATNEDSDTEDVGDGVEPAEDDALINSTMISHPDDEVTQPSSWSPAARPENTSPTGPTNFQGILGNISHLNISQPELRQAPIDRSVTPLSEQNSSRSNSQPNFESMNQDQQGNSTDGSGTNITIFVGINAQINVPK